MATTPGDLLGEESSEDAAACGGGVCSELSSYQPMGGNSGAPLAVVDMFYTLQGHAAPGSIRPEFG
jgi:hypothetical protein